VAANDRIDQLVSSGIRHPQAAAAAAAAAAADVHTCVSPMACPA